MKRQFCLLLLLPLLSVAQSKYTVSGTVRDANGAGIAYANITLDKGSKYDVADQNGDFRIKGVAAGTYLISVSSLGFTTLEKRITVAEDLQINFDLSEAVQSLDDVVVRGKSKSQIQAQQPIAITSINALKLESLGLGAEELLKQSSGVVVRQSGGLGSDININLNGLTQRAVRVFYDGMPIEIFGGGLQINTIPVDALERIDVYKGVMPVHIGTDALGGGINLVPRNVSGEYLRVSYLVGSFNTHRVNVNGRKKISEKVSLALSSFFNYSDNDYEMRDIETIVPTEFGVERTQVDAKRFHDRHISGYADLSLRVDDVSWADRFEIGGGYFTRDDEIQNGIQLLSTAIGDASRERTTLSAKVDYRKRFFNDKLNVRYYGVLATTNTKTNDSTDVSYNWRGEIIGPNGNGAEIAPFATLRDADNLSIAQRLILAYELTPTTEISVSEFFRNTEIEGEDPIGPRLNINGQQVDPNTIPSKLQQNVLGVQLEQRLFKDALTAQAFYKNYNYLAETIDILQVNATQIPTREVSQNNNGYGVALKYAINDHLFVRTSYERALRMPDESEVFGDFATIRPNFELRPEQSDNLNLGVDYTTFFSNETSISFGVNGFLRNRKDLIRLAEFGPESAIFINESEVDGNGVEVTVLANPLKNLTLNGSFTRQSNEIAAVGANQDETSIGAQVPNIPNLYFNAGASYKFPNFLGSPNELEVSWNYLYIDRYSINEVQDLDTANPDFIVPTQQVHNAGLVYNFQNKPISVSFNLNNVFNAQVFDNWRVPRPGVNYTVKINYTIK